MNKKQLEKLKKSLTEQKQNLLNSIANQEELDLDGDDTDHIQAKILFDSTKALKGRDLLKIKQIDIALDKIKNGSFGSCEECGEDIGEKRLLFNPSFSMCVGCAEENELRNKSSIR